MTRPVLTSLLAVVLLAGCGSKTPPPLPGEHGRFEAVQVDGLAYPARLAVGGDGTIYVSDVEAGRVVGFRDGAVVMVLSGLDRPAGLAVRGERLYVGNLGRKTVEIHDLARERHLRTLGPVALPTSLAVDEAGMVYVADGAADLVRVFDAQGREVRTFGGRGSEAGRFVFPSAIVVDEGRVVVADQGNHRIQIFDRRGRHQKTLGAEVPENAASEADYAGRFTRIQGLALRGEDLLVLDSVHGHVQILGPEGQSKGFLGRLGTCERCVRLALDVALDREGRVLVTDPENHRWVVLDP